MITEDYGENFWNHPVIKDYESKEGIFLIKFNDLIIRRHQGGIYCFGIENNTIHFHSSDLERAFLKVVVYKKSGEEWFKQT